MIDFSKTLKERLRREEIEVAVSVGTIDVHEGHLAFILTLSSPEFLLDQRNRAPPNWKSAKEMFTKAYQHEQKVTESINSIVELARKEKDNATEVFLQWFVNEQVEEEASTNEITQKLHVVGDNAPALVMLDAELHKRSSST